MSAGLHLVLLTRVPVPGRVKTRLMGALSGAQCARLQRALALDVAERLGATGLPLTVRYSDEAQSDDALLRGFLADVEDAWKRGGGRGVLRLEPQRGDGLGARMASAIEDELAHGAAGCLLMGSDLPLLGAELLAPAVAMFGGDSPSGTAEKTPEPGASRPGLDVTPAPHVVLGPTDDGGYWLVGLRRPFGELFAGKRYGSGGVLEEALATCRAHGRTAALGPATRDVDTPDDLRQLAALVAAGDPRVGRRTAQVVRSLGRLE